jgi:phosphoribosylformylglycinamidine synthase
MKFGVAVYPGSNCDYDTYYIIRDILKKDVDFVDYREYSIQKYDCIIVPGGFSFGDYLRPGAIASHTPLTNALKEFAEKGKFIIGICNGFQILTEAHLLPGALLPNNHGRFVCKHQHLKVENDNTPFTKKLKKDQVIKLPIAHHDGNYFVDEETLKKMEEKGQIILRYCDKDGNTDEKSNPNGSISNIAGVCNDKFNVFGLMPHPERACEPLLGSSDGLNLLLSLIE